MNNGTLDMERNDKVTGQLFDSPLYVSGGVTGEPERYLAEKPYELSKYEFSILKKGKFSSDIWVPSVIGAIVGFILAVIGKLLQALIAKQNPSLEQWEIWAIIAGIIVCLLFKFVRKRTSEEKEFERIKQYIDQHFLTSPKRRVHVTREEEDNQ